jgi:hypothetical protein
MSNSSNLFNSVLVGSEVRLKRFVFLFQSLQLVQLAMPEVLALQHFFFTLSPFFVDVCLVLEFLGQMFQTLKPIEKFKLLCIELSDEEHCVRKLIPHHLSEKPFFE